MLRIDLPGVSADETYYLEVTGTGATLTVSALRVLGDSAVGDSISVDGACQTVTRTGGGTFSVFCSKLTLQVTTLGSFVPGRRVNLERAVTPGGRLGGHIVQGHVDTLGTVRSVTDNGNSYDVIIDVGSEFIPLIPPKGSITIDGVSLTVNDVYDDAFRLTIIPITMRETLFGTYKKGTRVNIETDVFARYMRHILTSSAKKDLSWNDIDHISALY